MRPKWLTRLGSSPVAPESLLGTPAATPFWRYSHPEGILPSLAGDTSQFASHFGYPLTFVPRPCDYPIPILNCHNLLQCTRCPSGLSLCFPGPLATPECTPAQGTPKKKTFCCFSISPCRFTISNTANMAAAASTQHHRGMQIFATFCMPPVAAQGSPSFSTERTS